ncbi:family 2 glycosyl transferase [Pedobacter lusitanus]|uniref:Family 2 glycosyl transferase n=1 Tax=Pedobacter lusitanus TaxID=1503925 RepID=A0A0D0F770_9SPHI|nr:glycosyltransferase [Pedobacter lusitanus]KIO77468.1 family 2 glycosyl transferase [Pedobacter lusitanus]
MEIKVSVVIPTYRRPKLLIDCLRALLMQSISKTDFEVIIVSDGPDHQTLLTLLPWLKKKELQLSYLQLPVKKGPAAARNIGWTNARSTVIAFTDDDCLPDRNWLSAILEYFTSETDLAVSGKTYVPVSDTPTDFEWNMARLENSEFITANCACTKNALRKAGGFDERFKLAWREDSDLHFKLLKLKIPVISAPGAVVIHPIRDAPWGISLKEQKKGIYDALLFKKFPVSYRERINKKPLWNYYLINLLWIILLISIIENNKWLAALSIAALTILISDIIHKRLYDKKKTISHIIEMVSTSFIIPTLSVFWRIYGAIKYRVFFI